MIPSLDGFVGIYKNFFSKEECEEVIKEFKRADELGLTFTRQEQGDLKLMKDDKSYWSGRNDMMHKDVSATSIDSLIVKRFNHRFFDTALPLYLNNFPVLNRNKLANFGSKVQETPVSSGYHVWHCERTDRGSRDRVMAWIIYLNDVDEGGETEFLYQRKRFKPEQGTLILFPVDYTHVHRGNPPLSNTKYIMTGWIEFNG